MANDPDDNVGGPSSGCPGDDCADTSNDKLTPESVLAKLDELLADSGGAYSSNKIPIDQALHYSVIAANRQVNDAITPLIGVLAGTVVARVQFVEDSLQRIMRPQKNIIRNRLKRQEQLIQQLINQLGNCISARTGYCQSLLADCQAKMLGAQAAPPISPAPAPESGDGAESEEGAVGPPTPTALGLVPPSQSATASVSTKPCTYIDICDKEGWWAWWYYWWAWLVWWWSWFRWYLRAAWACFAKRCNLPAHPYSVEGMAYVLQLEQSVQPAGFTPPLPVPGMSNVTATATVSQVQSQYQSLYDSLAAPEILAIIDMANRADADKVLPEKLGSKDQSLPDEQHQFLDHPIDLEHFPIETLPEE